MAHEAGHTGPYGELFELPGYNELEGRGGSPYEIDFANPTPQDLARIQQDPQLQLQYIQALMSGGGDDPGYFGGDTYDVRQWSGEGQTPVYKEYDVIDAAESRLRFYLGPVGGKTIEDFLGLDEEQIRDLLTPVGSDAFSEDQINSMVGYFQELQAGMGKLQSGESNITALERELGRIETGVTGPGGLTQQKGTMADILQQKIGASRQAYVPKEKVSRYGKVTGTGGGVDPTSSYVSGVEGDVSAYGTSITDIDKSIQDILTGTEAGSIFDIYGQYGKEVTGSLFGTGGDLWWEG